MDYDERSIRDFLKGYPGRYVSMRVIARRVGGKRRSFEDPQWAIPLLNSMQEKGVVEANDQGHYRLKKVAPIDRSNRRWVSPQYRRILEQSSKNFSKVINLDADEENEV